MWSIVRAGSGIETPEDGAHRNGAASHAAPPDVPRETNGAANGAHVEPPRGEPGLEGLARSLLVNVYLHPGRTLLASMPVSRAAEQFDLRRARDFTSLDEAEAACEGRTGFLLELCESMKGRGAGNIRFVSRLRD